MPNFSLLHPAVVHFPIGLLITGSFVALLYLFGWRRYYAAQSAWLMLLIGWFGGILAILTGLLAQRELPPLAPYRDILDWHTGSGIALAAIYGFLLYRRWLWRQRRKATDPVDLLDHAGARWWLAFVLLLGVGLVVLSGFLGGVLVYGYGVNVRG
jgi:uncharacterized membrane protein